MIRYTIAFAALAALLAGCGKPSVSRLPYDQMSDRDFVAVVNGIGYTKGELERDVAITEKLYALQGAKAADTACVKDPAGFRRTVINGFIARTVLLGEANRRQITLSPSDMAEFQNQFAASASGKIPLDFSTILSVLGEDATAFRNNLKDDALSAKMEMLVKDQIAASLPPPKPAELARERQAVAKANKQAEADNRRLYRLATNAWKSIRAGTDFAEAGKTLTTMGKGIAYETDYQDAAQRFADLADGTLTPPTAVNGGLEVAKLTTAPNGKRRISRIFFKPAPLRPLPTAEGQTTTYRTRQVNARFAEYLKELKKSAEISTATL